MYHLSFGKMMQNLHSLLSLTFHADKILSSQKAIPVRTVCWSTFSHMLTVNL